MSIKLETLRDERYHCCEREHVRNVLSELGVTCLITCVNVLCESAVR